MDEKPKARTKRQFSHSLCPSFLVFSLRSLSVSFPPLQLACTATVAAVMVTVRCKQHNSEEEREEYYHINTCNFGIANFGLFWIPCNSKISKGKNPVCTNGSFSIYCFGNGPWKIEECSQMADMAKEIV